MSPDELPEDRPLRNRGHFFIIDKPTFAAVCETLGPDHAAAYLVLCAGTSGDNRVSSWSIEAIANRTAANWRIARTWVEQLESVGFVRWLERGRKPRLELPLLETRVRMSSQVQLVMNRIRGGHQPKAGSETSNAMRAEAAGWVQRDELGQWRFINERPLEKVYLPMSVVGDEKGRATGYSTIVDRIRKSRDPMAMRLLVDLYSLQDLCEHGGVDPHYLWMKFDCVKAGATSQFQCLRFTKNQNFTRVHDGGALAHHRREPTREEKADGKNSAQDFFARMEILEDSGALEWVLYVVEDEDNPSLKIFPAGVVRHGKQIADAPESVVGAYATAAACVLSEQTDYAEAWEQVAPVDFFLPVDRLARKAALIGIPRLRGCARTINASRWKRESAEQCAEWIQSFRGIIQAHDPDLLTRMDLRFADFNVSSTETSTKDSTLVQRDLNDLKGSPMHDIRENSFRGASDENDLSVRRVV